MKKLIVLLIFLVSLSSIYSQEAIKFLGIDWGITQKKLIAEMASRGFTDYFSLDDSTISFIGEIAGGDGSIILYTYKNQFYKASILVETYISAKEIAEILIEKYGPPEMANEDLIFFYSWEHKEKGSLQIMKTGRLISLDYLDGVIEIQKMRDELAGL